MSIRLYALVSLIAFVAVNASGCAQLLTKREHDSIVKDKEETIQKLEKKAAESDDLRLENEKLRAENAVLKAHENVSEVLSTEVRELLAKMNDKSFDGATIVKGQNGETGLRFDGDVFFGPGQSKLTPAGQSTLKRVAESFKGKPVRFHVVGHTDSDPIIHTAKDNPTKMNLELGANRALSVAEALHKDGIPENRMFVTSKGSNDPLDANSKRKNRRVEIWIVK